MNNSAQVTLSGVKIQVKVLKEEIRFRCSGRVENKNYPHFDRVVSLDTKLSSEIEKQGSVMCQSVFNMAYDFMEDLVAWKAIELVPYLTEMRRVNP